MPLGGDKLSDADLAIISAWIKAMKPATVAATNGEPGLPTRKPGYSITDKDRAFWSFTKPARVEPPAVKNRAWTRNDIDAFVLSKLEANGLAPAPKAAPRELLRRVYFDLIGLPPTPAEMAAWLKNPSAQTYDEVIEKLLASPHYGERWGRHGSTSRVTPTAAVMNSITTDRTRGVIVIMSSRLSTKTNLSINSSASSWPMT